MKWINVGTWWRFENLNGDIIGGISKTDKNCWKFYLVARTKNRPLHWHQTKSLYSTDEEKLMHMVEEAYGG